jgi:hypothetical protein
MKVLHSLKIKISAIQLTPVFAPLPSSNVHKQNIVLTCRIGSDSFINEEARQG